MKGFFTPISAFACVLLSLVLAQGVHAAEELKGSWTITKSADTSEVQFGLKLQRHGGSHQSNSDWPKSQFPGVDFNVPGKQDVKVAIVREAGRFDLEGYLRDGEGGGVFRLTPDATYLLAMQKLGFDGLDEGKQFGAALHDVTTDFARQMRAENLSGLGFDQLIAFRIFDVNPTFIHALRAEGLPAHDSDKLIAFRVHGVTPEVLRELRRSGFDVNEDQVIAMRVHGVTPEWIAAIRKAGLADLDADKLIAFRVHEVTPEYIASIEKLGFGKPDPDQLVAMKVHGITPEYIAGLKKKGMKDLTLDKLVSLKVHGIN
jgi:hypothetical protein